MHSQKIQVTFINSGVTFTVDAPVVPGTNEMLRKIINKILETVVRRTFVDLWVLPKWRTAYLPFLDPIVDTPSVSIAPENVALITLDKKVKQPNCSLVSPRFLPVKHLNYGNQRFWHPLQRLKSWMVSRQPYSLYSFKYQ